MRHIIAITAAFLLFAASPALALTTSECFDCHSDDTLSKTVQGKEVSLFVDEEVYGNSIHGDMDCTDCHEDLVDVEDEHEEKLELVQCDNCHDDAAEKMESGGHPADCTDCHGKHDILPREDSRSTAYDLNVPATCCACHSDGDNPESCEQWENGAHGKVLIRDGVIQAAVCNDCHGSHDISGRDHPESRIARGNINATCGSCHEGILETFRTSVHSAHREGEAEDTPVCISCHSPHMTEAASGEEFHLTVVERCSSCHEEMGYSFARNYHGQLTWLGSTKVAQCPDCHGAHGILSGEDPSSMVHPDNLVSTCGACHTGINRNFTLYMPHADYHDAEHYPLLYFLYLAMVFLLFSVFFFFGIHTLLWFIRSFKEYLGRSGGAH